MGRYIWIVFVGIAVWQVISTVIEKATKKQQEQRLRELAAQRQRQLSARGGGHQPSPLEARPAPAVAAKSALERVEDLASRRRAQLDELRRRRAARKGGPAELRTAGPQTPRRPAAARPAPAPAPAPTNPFQAPPQRRPGPAIPQTVSVGRSHPAPVPQAPRQRPQPQARPQEAPTVRRLVRPEPTEPRVRASRPPRQRPSIVIGNELLGPNLLRKMVIYKEILDLPVSLRHHQVWDRV